MNPVFWDEDRCTKLKQSEPSVYLTDCAAEFSSPEESLFPSESLNKSVWRGDPSPVRGAIYEAGIDPATRTNAFTLVVGTNIGGKKRIVLARQWIGSKIDPLKPREVLREIAEVCRPYGVACIESDSYYLDALADIGRDFGLIITQRKITPQDYLNIRHRMLNGEIEFVPEILQDLRSAKKKVTANGVKIELPITADGRHADYAPAAALVLSRFIERERDVQPDTEADRMRKAAQERWGKKRAVW